MDHTDDCTDLTCYCFDERGEPMCDCGQPGLLCRCFDNGDLDSTEILEDQRWDKYIGRSEPEDLFEEEKPETD